MLNDFLMKQDGQLGPCGDEDGGELATEILTERSETLLALYLKHEIKFLPVDVRRGGR